MFGVPAASAPADSDARLINAAKTGNAGLLSQVLAEGANPRFAEPQQQNTALHLAAKVGSAPCIELLLRAGADANATNSVSATPLIYAAQQGHLDAARALLASGARKDVLTRKGKSALALAEEKNHAAVVALLNGTAGAGPAAGGFGAGGGFGAPFGAPAGGPLFGASPLGASPAPAFGTRAPRAEACLTPGTPCAAPLTPTLLAALTARSVRAAQVRRPGLSARRPQRLARALAARRHLGLAREAAHSAARLRAAQRAAALPCSEG